MLLQGCSTPTWAKILVSFQVGLGRERCRNLSRCTSSSNNRMPRLSRWWCSTCSRNLCGSKSLLTKDSPLNTRHISNYLGAEWKRDLPLLNLKGTKAVFRRRKKSLAQPRRAVITRTWCFYLHPKRHKLSSRTDLYLGPSLPKLHFKTIILPWVAHSMFLKIYSNLIWNPANQRQ